MMDDDDRQHQQKKRPDVPPDGHQGNDNCGDHDGHTEQILQTAGTGAYNYTQRNSNVGVGFAVGKTVYGLSNTSRMRLPGGRTSCH